MMNIRLILILFLTLFFSASYATEKEKYYLIAGYGYYEAAYIGLKYEGIKNSRWQIGLGTNFNVGNIKYTDIFCEYQMLYIIQKDYRWSGV